MSTIFPIVNKWLTSKVNDCNVSHKWQKPLILPRYSGKMPETLYGKYYAQKGIDIDIKNTDPNLSKIIKYDCDNFNNNSLELVTELYGDKSVLLPPNSNQYHANYLFKQLIDHTYDITFDVPMIAKNGVVIKKKLPMFGPEFKNSFYNFCHKYS